MARRYRPGLPGGRARYQTADAYASQSREYESRIDQAPGYVSAILQGNLTVGTGATVNVPWTTTTVSPFSPALQTFGWNYDPSSNIFTCRRPGKYQISVTGLVPDSPQIGEYVQSLIETNSVNAWLSATPKNITSINLTAGDWDVQAGVNWQNVAITGTVQVVGVSTTPATLPGNYGQARSDSTMMPTVNAIVSNTTGLVRLSLSGTTTVYCVGLIAFSAGVPTCGGWIRARRVTGETLLMTLNVIRDNKTWQIQVINTGSSWIPLTQVTDFQFRVGDRFYVTAGNSGVAARTLQGLGNPGAGGGSPEQQFTNLKMWQID